MISLAALYQDFANIFMGGRFQQEHAFVTLSGHPAQVFDHNFFHLVKLSHSSGQRRFRIEEERDIILQHVDNFGMYAVDTWRARALPTAFDTLNDPDEVLDGLRESGSATHCFMKRYGGGPMPYTVTLAKLNSGYFIPVTSFTARGTKAKKIRDGGKLIWEK